MRRVVLVAVCVVLLGCGERALSAGDAARWAPGGPRRSAIPVLVYGGGELGQFARQMRLLRHAGYETVGLDTFVGFLRGERVALPARPFVLTFDGARRDTRDVVDPVLRELGLSAVVFTDVGRAQDGAPGYLGFRELADLERSHRWDVQLRSGTGGGLIRYGPGRGDVGPFYAYRGESEVLFSWRERVFEDIAMAERQLARRIAGYRPLAFSPPYGNYGQVGTNDPEIPRLLLARLHDSFPVVFTQDRPGLARPGQGTADPVGRLAMTAAHGEQDLLGLINTR